MQQNKISFLKKNGFTIEKLRRRWDKEESIWKEIEQRRRDIETPRKRLRHEVR